MPAKTPCGYTLDGLQCAEVGDHFCVSRADHAQAFFEELLCHTKGTYARRPFILADWQRDDIIRPLFGTVEWSDEQASYKRRYEVCWIEIARKNGKSELLAGIMLYLLVADGEESAEIFGVARNREQASLVFDVAAQMVRFSPVLAKRLKITPHKKRIFDERTHSFYQVIAADAQSALGSNPSGVGADEILAWRDGGMWDSLRTGMGSGARRQPLMVAATTAGNDPEGFAGLMHKEMQRIAEDPGRSPHTFVYLRNLDVDADPWDENNWPLVNPAIGDFLSIEAMRKQALEARTNPISEMAFRQFRLNQWQNSTVRWMQMHLWDRCAGVVHRDAAATLSAFEGRECWFGLDLAARQDLAAVCYLFPSSDGVDLVWRFWAPESAVERLDQLNSNRFSGEFAQDGWLTITEGDVLDFERVYADIESDARRFVILGGDADKWSSDPVIQEIESRTYVQQVFAYTNDFSHMSDGMHRIFELVTEGKFRHHGNPLARFCFDACEARVAKYNPDLIRPDKPNRSTAAKRIDGVPAAIMAVNAWHGRGNDQYSVYADHDVLVI
jgi:phage terminase large subunit-like protein